MRIELFAVAIIAVSVFVSISIIISTITHAQISPEYPQLSPLPQYTTNLTELCDQYVTMPGVSAEGIMQCLPYYNDTVKEKLGFTGPEWE